MTTTLPKILLLIHFIIMLTGCSNLLFVTDKDGNKQIYKMRITEVGSLSTTLEVISHNAGHTDRYPDISPDTNKLTYASVRSGQSSIATRVLADMSGSSETVLHTSTNSTLMSPRWSCQQDLIAYADRTQGSNDAKIYVIRSDGSGTPVQIANPGTYAGHDWIFGGNYIIYSSRVPGGNQFDFGLSIAKADGNGTVLPFILKGELPTTSHDGSLLVYIQRRPIAPGWEERIYVANAQTFATIHSFTIQPRKEVAKSLPSDSQVMTTGSISLQRLQVFRPQQTPSATNCFAPNSMVLIKFA